MRGAVLKEYGEPLEIERRETPAIADDEVLVETEACGICRSDWHGWQGDYAWLEGGAVTKGNILGHEPAGRIIETGNDIASFSEGEQVVVPFNIVCGKCRKCRNGDAHMCENVLHYGFNDAAQPGAFSTHLRVPNADFNLARVPDGISAHEMAGLGCRYVTSYHAIADRSGIQAGDWVVVHGCGGIGLSVVDVATALGGNVVAVDLTDDKLSMAEEMGAVATINGSDVADVPSEVRDITDGGAQISVDGLGVRTTCLNSINSVEPTGTHVQIGITTSEEEGRIDLPIDYMLHAEIDCITAKGFQPHRYDEIFRLMHNDKIHPDELVTKHVGLEDVNDRLEAMTDFETKGVEVITEF
ncbi:alcohol dehydrogenase catalytic domain-containing protein [Halococcus agarilyticus]|uniref:alcohol dehydrogenase catalytic domain-containing protein n=1 Tax=Halococcus agarilyticus TaxID=1232219 RepID=UPI0006778C91|nr:alcohol dehydrogenase catalytic domain-containing protein [Halococcus agarilyticus]